MRARVVDLVGGGDSDASVGTVRAVEKIAVETVDGFVLICGGDFRGCGQVRQGNIRGTCFGFY